MTIANQKNEDILRQGFKLLNRGMMLNWRLGMGPYLSIWPHIFGRFVVLVHTGRKSGLTRRTPLNYAEIDGEIYVTAGFGKIAHWYKNIMAQPHIEVWLPDGWWQAQAEDVSNCENHLEIMRAVMKGSGFASFLAGMNPYTISDEVLQAACADYRLLRIRRTAPCTGIGGPGDLAWVWPALVHLLLPLLIWQRRKRVQKG
jgi:deazaflavin-dependent oxidoreductase (nitroreductase family)